MRSVDSVSRASARPRSRQGSCLGSFLEVVIGRGHRGQALDHPSPIVQRLLDRECPLIGRKGLVVMTMRAVQPPQARQRPRQVAARPITGFLEPRDGQIEGFGRLRESSTRKQGNPTTSAAGAPSVSTAPTVWPARVLAGELGALVVVSDKLSGCCTRRPGSRRLPLLRIRPVPAGSETVRRPCASRKYSTVPRSSVGLRQVLLRALVASKM